jgi:hypothetical protein
MTARTVVPGRAHPRRSSGVGPAVRPGCAAPAASRFTSHETRKTRNRQQNPAPTDHESAARLRRPGLGGGGRRGARPRRPGHRPRRGGDGRRLGVHVPLGDRGGGRRALLDGTAAGSGHRRHPGDPRAVAPVGLVELRTPWRHPDVRGDGAHRHRHRGRVRPQRGGETGGGRGTPLPGPARHRGDGRRMPAARRLVLPEQPRHPGRRPRGRPGRAAPAPGGRHPAGGRGGGAAAGRGGGALPARRAGRRGPRGLRGGGRPARVPAARPDRGVSAREAAAAARRSRPRGRRRPRRPGCPRPAGPGWSSHGP